ncbi:hypothetical protein [Arthrobacter sp. ISL-5]|uniref:hypothetical protein n=1 Tax=Arthrobacter sp. ISL-5 TaxID=2819111 RepID=UPI001BEC7B6C|nr:hypothetical protein [Arthrobacter sp. ISL-5]MBT2554008.1 hypothetical protein [Arthrobacter sp. ISL-5]
MRLVPCVLDLAEGAGGHLGYAKHDPAGRDGGNSRNGRRSKTLLTTVENPDASAHIAPGEACRLLGQRRRGGGHLSSRGGLLGFPLARHWVASALLTPAAARPEHHQHHVPRHHRRGVALGINLLRRQQQQDSVVHLRTENFTITNINGS